MNEATALLHAAKEFPEIPDWHSAFPVLPTPTSPISTASWLVVTTSNTHYALVDGGPRSVLMSTLTIKG